MASFSGDRQQGEGEAGEVHWIREHTESIEARLDRMEALLRELRER